MNQLLDEFTAYLQAQDLSDNTLDTCLCGARRQAQTGLDASGRD